MSTVCWVFPDIGHYHQARIRAFAEQYDGEVVIVQVGDKSPFEAFKSQNTDALKCRVRTLFKGQAYTNVPRSRQRVELQRCLDEIRPAVVCVQGWSETLALAPLAWAQHTGTPVVVTSESQAQDFTRPRWKEAVKKRIIRQFSAAVAGGTPHADYLFELGMPRERVLMGYDVVDNGHFAAGADIARSQADNVRARLELPQHYFLASCRFIEKKNLRLLIRAYAKYRQKCGGAAWKLLLLGDGALRPELLALRDELQLQDALFMPGFKTYDELPSYYGLAEAFVHASTVEQWGLVVNEAMAAGLPVLVSERCGCAANLVSNARNGFTFSPFNEEDLINKMMQLHSNAPALNTMGQASREIIRAWSPDYFGKSLCAAAQIALNSKPRKASLSDRALLWALLRFGSGAANA